ncbi:thioesterase family protein [Neobacillus sp. 114]|uniref:acyl-CoA thioesterase n=1 Tax=Neobacillus sp. 114 TaxID=3048535 RepID=UPI0024C3910C|nr:thioesterase family protein [Neobacillus sp. 114]
MNTAGKGTISRYKLKVRLGDTDMGGIVYYPNYHKWMDEATHEYLGAIGVPSSKLFSQQNIGVPLLESKCNIHSPLFFEDCVEVVSSVLELFNKVFKISHLFYKNDHIVAEGYEIRAWATFEGKLKTHPIPQEIREKMVGIESIQK